MPQNEQPRPDFINLADTEHQQEIRNWFQRQHGRYFSGQETLLQCVVALRYADPTRPTVRQLWHHLHHLIVEDARLLVGKRPQRLPSYSTFRSRIADLPRDFVWQARAGQDNGRPSIMLMVSRFEAIIPSRRVIGY